MRTLHTSLLAFGCKTAHHHRVANPQANADVLREYRFPPGVSGNPHGRKPKRPLTTEYEKRAGEPLDEPTRMQLAQKFGTKDFPVGVTWARAAAILRWRDAMRPGTAGTLAMKEIADRIEGKSTQRLQVEDHDMSPVKIVVEYEPALPGRYDDQTPASEVIEMPLVTDQKQLPDTPEPDKKRE